MCRSQPCTIPFMASIRAEGPKPGKRGRGHGRFGRNLGQLCNGLLTGPSMGQTTATATKPASAGGAPLSAGQLRQLQWIVPVEWAPEATSVLARLPLAGARVSAFAAGSEHWLGFFDGERMVDEALRPAAYSLACTRGLLPVAGCGRRTVNLYFVEVGASDLPLWCAAPGGELVAMSIGLNELWAACQFEPRVQLRRRLPDNKGPVQRPKTLTPPSRTTVAPAARCPRTLPLFA